MSNSKELNNLIELVKELNNNLTLYKKTKDRNESSEVGKLEKISDNIQGLDIELRKQFKNARFWKEGNSLQVKKIQKDFIAIMQSYSKILKSDVEKKQKQLQLMQKRRTTMYNRESTVSHPNRSSQEEESEQGVNIQLQDVNQETLHYENMIKLKQKQLLQVKTKMEDALRAQKQVGKLVKEQGQKLDIVEDQVDSARSNVKDAGDLLEQGVQSHKSATRTKRIIFGVVFLLLVIIIVPILIKFT